MTESNVGGKEETPIPIHKNKHPEIYLCGVDCFPGDEKCNGYCSNASVESPPLADKATVISRKHYKARLALKQATDAARDYYEILPAGIDKVRARKHLSRLEKSNRAGGRK